MCKALIQAKGTRGLRQRNRESMKPRVDSYEGMSRVISTVAALIITVSFAAAFTIPGGFNNDGKAVLEKKWLLWLFILTDALALFASIIVELVLLLAAIGDVDLLIAAHSISIKLMAISLVSLALAFIFGLLSIVPIVLAIFVFIVLVRLLSLVLHWVWHFPWFPLFYLSLKRSIKYKLSSIICPYSSHKSLSQHLSSIPMEHLPTHLPHQSSSSVEDQPSHSLPTNPPPSPIPNEIQHKNPLQNSASSTEIPNTNQLQSSNQVESRPTNAPPIEIQGRNLPESPSEIVQYSNQPHVSSQVEIQTTNLSQSPAPFEIQHTNLHTHQPQSSVSFIIRGAHRSPILDLFRAYVGPSLSSETLTTLPNLLQNLNIQVNLPMSLIGSLISSPNSVLRLLRYLRPQTSNSREIPHTNQLGSSISIEIGEALQSSILNSIIPRALANSPQDHFIHTNPFQPPTTRHDLHQHLDTSSNSSSNSRVNVALARSLSLSVPSKNSYAYAELLQDN